MTPETTETTETRYGPALEPLRLRVEEALRERLDAGLAGAPDLTARAVRDAVLSPGKRLRPLLLLATYEACGGRHPAAATLACSVELVHAYSLVHDDLPCMDDDVLRRGRPTLHVRYGSEAAVFVGAALMPLAARTVEEGGRAMGLEAGRRRRLLALLAEASGASGMVGGQLLDLRAEGRPVSRRELERIHRGKTAALIGAAVRMGGVAAGEEEAAVERLGGFGLRLGLAFQAVDDILDVTAETRQLGKTRGRDQALAKATFPSVLGLEEARRLSRELAGEARRELEALGGVGDALPAIVRMVVERRS